MELRTHEGWGGQRPGAGRKPAAVSKKSRSFYVSDDEYRAMKDFLAAYREKQRSGVQDVDDLDKKFLNNEIMMDKMTREKRTPDPDEMVDYYKTKIAMIRAHRSNYEPYAAQEMEKYARLVAEWEMKGEQTKK